MGSISLAIVRDFVTRLMQATDDEKFRKRKPPERLKWKMPKTRKYPDEDDDDPERIRS